MTKKQQPPTDDKENPPPRADTVKDSAQQIWLAGLGAFAKAQQEGGKVFEALVKDGLSIQRKTQAAAEEKISETTSKMSAMAGDIQAKAGHQWDKLENIFEDRVAKALHKLGVPSARDVDILTARIDELSLILKKKTGHSTTPVAPKNVKTAASRGTAAKRPAAKRPAARKSA